MVIFKAPASSLALSSNFQIWVKSVNMVDWLVFNANFSNISAIPWRQLLWKRTRQ